MKRIVVIVVIAAAALAAITSAAASGYHGRLLVDYRYTSGGAISPGSPADIEQTAHLVFTVKNSRIVHMHGVVGFDWKEVFSGCPNFTAETIGGGTVDASPQFGIDPEFYPRWTGKGRYVTPEPSAPPAGVTSKSTTPANDCSTESRTDQATFQLRYMTAVRGKAPINAKRVTGSLVRNLSGFDDCHPFDPLPPPPPAGVSCTWRYRWSLSR
jgi:hypothetical protein